jgi:IS30 family transposase
VHETIYQAVYRPALGDGLTRELPPRVLRSRRRRRKPHRNPGARRRGVLTDMTMIDQRPADAEDRSVPGHWEGDLIMGSGNKSAIGTLVERTSRFTILLHLPDGYQPEQVRDALAAKIKTLPDSVRHTLTWDQGPEMRDWKTVSIDADIDIYFCDPHAPWQRGTNENTVSIGDGSVRLLSQAGTGSSG